MSDNSHVTTQDAATAALLWVAALTTLLIKKELLTVTEAHEIAATAAAMCRANSAPGGGDLIESILPGSKGAGFVEAATERAAGNC